ncbi:MAG TPA: flagellar basal body P-ring protein FlgI, partial [Planctomycetaceae bacterium]|nr:flagellar basal body P-ring protein FlgI [Planctomycetaceae bacterium]
VLATAAVRPFVESASFVHAADDNAQGIQVNTPLVGDYTNFAGLNPVLLEGVGLVVNLAGTGGNPAPSQYTTALLEDMRRRGVANPNQMLQSPNTALVIVRAYLPPLMQIGETLDVEVIAPDSADVSSLVGGWLMETYLHEQAFVPGRGVLKGHPYAKAKGAILIPGVNASAKPEDPRLKRGRVLGGATVLKKRELSIFLRNDFRSIRNSTRIAEAIGRRYHHFDEYGIKKPMAEAKTDQKIVLDVHPKYKDNYPRYLQVIRSVAFRETTVSQRVRLQQLHEELLTPESSERAALQLEAIGADALPVLKAGLKAPTLEVRFHSAMAMAYLEQSDAIPVLAEAIKEERAFRVFALAAMSTIDDAQAHLTLRDLMSDSSAETRYGAFRALWTLDRKDPFIYGEDMGVVKTDPNDPDAKPKKALWKLHVLTTEGAPMVHCTLRTRPEIVVFGARQELIPPMVLSAGRNVLVTAQPGSTMASITRFDADKPDQRREVPLRVADVIRTVDELGATYPDVVQMLVQASEQRNLPARLETDALPESGRVYHRPASPDKPAQKTKVGREHMSPNLFPKFDDSGENASEETQAAADKDGGNGMANVPSGDSAQEDSDKRRSVWKFWERSKDKDK